MPPRITLVRKPPLRNEVTLYEEKGTSSSSSPRKMNNVTIRESADAWAYRIQLEAGYLVATHQVVANADKEW